MDSDSYKYTNGEITILWQPTLCKHSGIYVFGLPAVFNPAKKPWIDCSKATSIQLLEQVKKYPSGALSILKNESD